MSYTRHYRDGEGEYCTDCQDDCLQPEGRFSNGTCSLQSATAVTVVERQVTTARSDRPLNMLDITRALKKLQIEKV